MYKNQEPGCVARSHRHRKFRVEGEITFLAQGLIHQHSSLLSQARNHIVISFLGEFRTVHDLRSIDEHCMSSRSRLDSTAELCVAACIQFAHTARCHPFEI
ncbi:hypothetical protein BsWGS_25820 [Bradybaena similaris]